MRGDIDKEKNLHNIWFKSLVVINSLTVIEYKQQQEKLDILHSMFINFYTNFSVCLSENHFSDFVYFLMHSKAIQNLPMLQKDFFIAAARRSIEYYIEQILANEK